MPAQRTTGLLSDLGVITEDLTDLEDFLDKNDGFRGRIQSCITELEEIVGEAKEELAEEEKEEEEEVEEEGEEEAEEDEGEDDAPTSPGLTQDDNRQAFED